ncbi:MAG: FkbM family methyltransferase [Deltaproteobacteria bacterium]|nr:FkbM family methyltransferase [Deltaproteobacteria bacterium]
MMTLRFTEGDIAFIHPDDPLIRNIVTGIFEGGEYPVLRLPGYVPETILDIGAHIGAATVYFAHQFPGAQIFCYEPSARNFHYLIRNTGFSDRIRALPYGLHNQTFETPLYYGTDQSAQDSIVRSGETGEEGETVSMVRVSEELRRLALERVSILKIDTEGCEIPILEEFLPVLDRIDVLYCEYHSEEDRIQMDRLLSSHFLLFYCYATTVHRGLHAYVSRSLATGYPELHRFRIPPHSP